MVARFSTILAHLAVQIISVASSTATGTRPITQPTELAAPLYPGPRLDVPSGAHPSYSWPPAEATASPTCKTVQFAFPSGPTPTPVEQMPFAISINDLGINMQSIALGMTSF
jgi:hypothetical protein